MSNAYFIDTTPAERDDAQAKLESYLRGEIPLKDVASDFSSYQDFISFLSTTAKDLDETVSKPSADNGYMDRIRALYAITGLRDAKYAYAGRRYLMAMGYNQKLRRQFNVALHASTMTGSEV